jgi:aromatic ring-opening dioxygenase catalytic subunit (LigB family)
MKKATIIYFSHGGGPLPILGDQSHQAMIDFMLDLPTKIPRPEKILVISAHWEEHEATLMSAERPAMFYDYYGFPEEAYKINYPAPGNPELATAIALMLTGQKIPAHLDPTRGFDHGLFIPLKMMYPEADIPCLQLSLLHSLDAAAHLRLGKALRGLLDENILVIGSGFSFHNQSAFFGQTRPRVDDANSSFQDWLIETCAGEGLDTAEREKRLVDWEQAPNARFCHPREEHLLPLLVCSGMAGAPGKVIFDDKILNKRALAFLWQ